jgi:chaperonin GroEL
VLQPRTSQQLQEGINLIAEAVRPTLGPRPRLVAMARQLRTEDAEILDDGAIIARRITEVSPRGVNTGAMMIREALWRMHADCGDGSTTMAVLYQLIFNEGLRYVTQVGANSMLLRSGLETGLAALLEALDREATPLLGKEQTADVARGMCHEDAELAAMLGEIFDIVGPDGLIIAGCRATSSSTGQTVAPPTRTRPYWSATWISNSQTSWYPCWNGVCRPASSG